MPASTTGGRMDRLAAAIAIAGSVVAWSDAAIAQSKQNGFELGVQVPSAISTEFDRADVGVGGRLSWYPAEPVGIESEINLYPGDFPGAPPFSRSRVEGLFGVTVGPRFHGVRPFATLRSGFLTVRKAPRPFACIAIFPPPLSCALASGRTLVALDVGGGMQVFVTPRTFFRIDASDRLLRYPGPVFDSHRQRRDAAFFGHDFRFAVGAGLRF